MLSVALSILVAGSLVPEQDAFIPVARRYFAEARAAAEADMGALWGKMLVSPILLIDPKTRRLYASHPDAEGRLVEHEGVWTGSQPDNLPAGNYALKWAGVRWTIIAQPTVPASLTERFKLYMHETFHWFQPELGLFVPSGGCPHMDTFDGRLWLRLEGRAIQAAVVEPAASSRAKHVSNALLFRAYRQSLISDARDSERRFELNEGLAQYTGIRLMGMPKEEASSYVARVLGAWPASRPSFSRWYAYDLIPAYGLLLDEQLPTWRNQLTKDSDVVALLARATAWTAPASLKSRAVSEARQYGSREIEREERKREVQRRQVEADLVRKFVAGPVIHLTFPSRKPFGFRTDEVIELPPHGTVFRNVRLEETWGVASIADGGVLLSPDRTNGWIAADNKGALSGVGWKLELVSGWSLVPAARAGDFELKLASGAGPLQRARAKR